MTRKTKNSSSVSYGQAAALRSQSTSQQGFTTTRASREFTTPNFSPSDRFSEDPNKQSETTDSSAYSLPSAAPIYSSSVSTNFNNSFVPPPQPTMGNEYFSDQVQSDYTSVVSSVGGTTGTHDDESYDVSGVDLSFEPDDDVSQLTMNISVTQGKKEDPDGHYSDDTLLYNTDKPKVAATKPKKKKPVVQPEKSKPLTTVEEQSQDTDSQPQSSSSPVTSSKQTIQEIMSRGVSKRSSFNDSGLSRLHLIAESSSKADEESGSEASENKSRGPPTVAFGESEQTAVNMTLESTANNGRSFYSEEDKTVGEGDSVYSS